METVYDIILAFEFEAQDANREAKQTEKVLKDLTDQQTKLTESVKQANVEIQKSAALSRVDEAKKRREAEVEEIYARAKKKTNDLRESGNRSGRVDARQTGLLNRAKRALTGTIARLAVRLGVAGAAIAVITQAAKSSVVIFNLWEEAVLQVTTRFRFFTATIGRAIDALARGSLGDFLEVFTGYSFAADEVVNQARRLREEQRRLALQAQTTTKDILEQKDVIQVLKERLQDLTDTGTPAALQKRLDLLEEINDREVQITKLRREQLLRQRNLLDQQRLLDIKLGKVSTEAQLQYLAARQKINNEITKLNQSAARASFERANILDSIEEELRAELEFLGQNNIPLFERILNLNLAIRDPNVLREENKKFLTDFFSGLEQDLQNVADQAIVAGLDPEKSVELILKRQIELLRSAKSTLQAELVEANADLQNATVDLLSTRFTGDDAQRDFFQGIVDSSQERIKNIEAALREVDVRLAQGLNELLNNQAQNADDRIRQALQNLADVARFVADVFSSLSQGVEERQRQLTDAIDTQRASIERLRESTLDANADIIQSEEEKLDRLVAARRRATAQVRTLATAEYIANSAAAIASAAASAGPAAVPVALTTFSALIGLVAQLRSQAAIFHEGTKSIKLDNSWLNKKGRREGFALVEETERVLSVDDNQRIGNLSNAELVKAAQLYRTGFKQSVADSPKADRRDGLLQNIVDRLDALQIDYKVDIAGFSAGMHKYMNSQSKFDSMRL